MIAEPALEPHRYTTFPAERNVLEWLLAESRRGVFATHYPTIVEIGAREGDTSEFLAQRRDFRRLVVIDPWDGTQDSAGEEVYARFMTRMDKYTHAVPYGITDVRVPPVEVWRMRSQDATPPADLGFVFHDGDHRDLSDLPKWWDALVPGGILAVHDADDVGWPEVGAAIARLGRPWQEYRYRPTREEVKEYGPGARGIRWKVKTLKGGE